MDEFIETLLTCFSRDHYPDILDVVDDDPITLVIAPNPSIKLLIKTSSHDIDDLNILTVSPHPDIFCTLNCIIICEQLTEKYGLMPSILCLEQMVESIMETYESLVGLSHEPLIPASEPTDLVPQLIPYEQVSSFVMRCVFDIGIGAENLYIDDLEPDYNNGIYSNFKGISTFTSTQSSVILKNKFGHTSNLLKEHQYITPISDNVFTWIFEFDKTSFNTTLRESLELFNCNIQLVLKFHSRFALLAPPLCEIEFPKFEQNLNGQIQHMNVFTKYWSPCINIAQIILHIHDYLNQHAVVEVDHVVVCHPLQEMKNQLIVLDNLFANKEQTLTHPDLHMKDLVIWTQNPNNTKKTTEFWAKGTGYGTNASSKWDIASYNRDKVLRESKIISTIENIIIQLQSMTQEDVLTAYDVLRDSTLIPYIVNLLDGTSLLEMGKSINLYNSIFNLIQNLCTEEGVTVLCIPLPGCKKTIYDSLSVLKEVAIKCTNDIDSDEKDETVLENTDLQDVQSICTLHEFITIIYTDYMERKLLEETTTDTPQIDIETKTETTTDTPQVETDPPKPNNEILYVETLAALQNIQRPFVNSSFRYYKELSTFTATRRLFTRLSRELNSMTLPLTYGSSVFIIKDLNNIACMRCLITGPHDTPYDSVMLVFDLFVPSNYPVGLPKIILSNTYNVRMNPNLYQEGKVCLTLLGTWQGHKSEEWNAETSTLQQLLVSIQSLILVPNPIFNEPGHEADIGSEKGDKKNNDYNAFIRLFTMRNVVQFLKNPFQYPELADIIITHLTLKKDHILETFTAWTSTATHVNNSVQHQGPIDKNSFETELKKIKELYEALPETLERARKNENATV